MNPLLQGRQFHYLSEKSHVHPFLVDLWDEVRAATGGKLDIRVHASNEGLKGTHLDIVQQMVDGEIEFYTLMGGILGNMVPALEVQGVPFAFRDHAQVHQVLDGELGDYLRNELLAKGIYALPYGLMENGFRHLCMVEKRILKAADLQGLRIRIPEGKMFDDTFRSLGATPVEVNVLQMRKAFADGTIDGHENPLAITDAWKLEDVTHCVSLTSHIWSGFNLMASKKFWDRLTPDVQDIVHRAVRKHIGRQRAHTDLLNNNLRNDLKQRGMTFVEPDIATFKQCLADGFYSRWKNNIGHSAWNMLESGVGKLV